MNIEVTRDNVTILEQSETPHENEYKITTCYFTFDEFTDSFQVKRAIFTILSTEEMYETDIINNQCDIPSEVLKHEYETVKLGVYGYNIGDNDELLNRFSPSYAEIVVPTGSYKEGALSPEPITPSQYDLYSQALQEGLQEVDDKLDEVVETVDSKLEEVDDKLEVVDGKIQDMDDALDDVDTAITETNNLNLDVSDKVDGDVTVTLTKKDASTKSVVISDGTSLMFNWDGTKLGVKTDEDSEYVYVDLQGIQGVPGPQGEPFRIKKTYSSVAEMNADFNNMQYGDYVMIASTVEIEDNAKLYTRGEYQWIFITDFSGAQGIKGETGATPNIQIGTVTSGSTPNVTRTGTNENPVLNFVLQPGEKGNTGDTGATGNGITSITKTSTSGLVDTYTITYTDGNTTTFNITNGNGIDHISLTSQSGATKVYTIYFTDGNTTTYTVEDGEVTQEVFDEEVERLKMVYNAMPKVSGEGTDLTLDNTAECPVYDIELSPSELEQESTTGKNLLNPSILGNGNIDTNTGLPSGTTGAFIRTNDYISVASSQTYAFQYGLKVSDVTGQIVVYEYDTNKDFIKFDVISGFSGTVTLSTTTEYIKLRLGAGTNQMEAFDYGQVEQNSSVTSYEPYTNGASPNPEFPQQIHTVSGENTITIENKNLAKSNWAESFVSAVNDNARARLDTKDGRNCLYYIANAGYGDYDHKNFSLGNTFKENTQYTVSYDILKTSTVSRTVGFYYTDGTRSASSDVSSVNTWYHQSITSTAGKTVAYIQPYYTSGMTYIDINTWQIEEGTTETTYEEHKEQNLSLSLGNLEYCKIGDYEDEFYKATESDTGLIAGKWYLKKNTIKRIFDGSEDEDWTAYLEYTNVARAYTTVFKDMPVNAGGYCNYFIKSSNNNADVVSFLLRPISSKIIVIKLPIDILSSRDVNGIKDWLSTHTTTMYYQLETPTYTLLSDTLQTQLDNIQKAITYQDQTNVSQTNNDLPFVIKLSAIRDLSGIFELIQ